MRHSLPPLHDMHKHTNPTSHIYGSVLISRQGKDPTAFLKFFQSMQYHTLNVFTHLPPTSFPLVFSRDHFYIRMLQQVLGFAIINHWTTITQNLKRGRELNSLFVSLAMEAAKHLSRGTMASNPKCLIFQVFTILLDVDIANFQPRVGDTIFVADLLALMFLQIVAHGHDYLLPPINFCAHQARHSRQVSH
jgi:hypothetical protein